MSRIYSKVICDIGLVTPGFRWAPSRSAKALRPAAVRPPRGSFSLVFVLRAVDLRVVDLRAALPLLRAGLRFAGACLPEAFAARLRPLVFVFVPFFAAIAMLS